MPAKAVPTPASAHMALPAADFSDAFAATLHGPRTTASALAARALGDMPEWVSRLLILRNILVRPLGLKPAPDASLPAENQIGFFPLLSATPDQVVLGLDDRHLDFRIVIDVEALSDDKHRVTATTLVKRNNALGTAYLAAVMPFHKTIVPLLLGRLAVCDAPIQPA